MDTPQHGQTPRIVLEEPLNEIVVEAVMKYTTLAISALAGLVLAPTLHSQVFSGRPTLDRSKPVPTKEQIAKVWRMRQGKAKAIHFEWTETQTHANKWLPNPRFPQPEWTLFPSLFRDRTVRVSKSLTVNGDKVNYTYTLYREEEADGVRVTADNGDNRGLGLGRHFQYSLAFDGRRSVSTLTAVRAAPKRPGTKRTSAEELDDPLVTEMLGNPDAQNLDTRPILMAFRAMDPLLGHTRFGRAVTNRVRTIHNGLSTFLLEEAHDPSGWKSILRIAPERDMTATQIFLAFEQKPIAVIDVDYKQDLKWGWVPNRWRITQMLADGSKRLLCEAQVTSYRIEG